MTEEPYPFPLSSASALPRYCDYCELPIRDGLTGLVSGSYVFCASCVGQAVIDSERSDRPPSVAEALRYLVSVADSRAIAHAETDSEATSRDAALRERRR